LGTGYQLLSAAIFIFLCFRQVVPMLIRVKTSDEADELEKLLNEKKAE